MVNQVYSGGLRFSEAITTVNTFRACHYLRAMAIGGLWATHTDWQRIPGAERGWEASPRLTTVHTGAGSGAGSTITSSTTSALGEPLGAPPRWSHHQRRASRCLSDRYPRVRYRLGIQLEAGAAELVMV